jgi:hypothetical protein
MRIDLVVHILAGAVGILSGFVALYVAKGATVHRRSGRVFVYAMVTMAVIGSGMAAIRGVAPAANVPAGVLTAYLVITGLVTVSPPAGWSRRWDIGLMLVASAFGLANLAFGFAALAGVFGERWMRFPFFVFGTVSLLASAGDIRMIRSGALSGAPRLARHLWRMCFALFIAAGSFFLGQAKVIPKPIRIFPLLAVPVVAVLVTMLYWLWRVRFRRTLRGIVGVTALEPVRLDSLSDAT